MGHSCLYLSAWFINNIANVNIELTYGRNSFCLFGAAVSGHAVIMGK